MQIEAPAQEDLLLRKLTSGDHKAFKALYDHYYAFVLTQVTYLLHSPDLAEDATQEIFLKIWENHQRLPGIQSFKSYLFITARNHSLNILKKSARSAAAIGEIVRQFDLKRNITEEQVLDNEYKQFIARKLEELPPRAREIFNLCREQGMSYNEVAKELGISRDAVKSRMMHVLKTLRHSAGEETGLNLMILVMVIGFAALRS